jgi:hypothetical protein
MDDGDVVRNSIPDSHHANQMGLGVGRDARKGCLATHPGKSWRSKPSRRRGRGGCSQLRQRSTEGRTQDRFGYSCSAGGECAAEAIFCCPTENSRHLEAQLTPKEPLFKEVKESARRTARSHVTLEKSSKNYICCENEPSQAAIQGFPPTFSQVDGEGKCASCRRRCNSPDLLAGWRGEGGVICGSMPFDNGSSGWAQIQHEDEQWCSAPLLF